MRKALEIDEALARELGTPEARRDLSASYDRLGGIEHGRSQWEAAEGWLRKALEIDEALATELGAPETMSDLSSRYERLGEFKQARLQWDAAEGWMRKAIEIDGARLLIWEAAAAIDRGEDAARRVRLAQDQTARIGLTVADSAVQIFGGHGYIRDYLPEMHLRNLAGLACFDGLALV